MIPDLAYTSRNLYISNQVRSRLMYLSDLKATSLHTKSFYYLINILTSIEFIIRIVVLTKLTSA